MYIYLIIWVSKHKLSVQGGMSKSTLVCEDDIPSAKNRTRLRNMDSQDHSANLTIFKDYNQNV